MNGTAAGKRWAAEGLFCAERFAWDAIPFASPPVTTCGSNVDSSPRWSRLLLGFRPLFHCLDHGVFAFEKFQGISEFVSIAGDQACTAFAR